MSKSIDERIVDMQFNNKQFESGIKESLGSIDKLKKGLDFKNAGKSFEGLNQAANKFSTAGIAEGVDKIASKFTTLGIIGVTALTNITNRAVDMGIALAKSLSIDQVTAGWSKYEEKTASVQTIMNSTGKTIDEVNGYLDKLMWFADETSYGFSDMTAALAQMTSTGGDIDTLIPLITGVANATAYAGKGAMEFSRAMYNLNQSYGSGSLQYMDWRSLELAGVASKELKQIFIDTGIELGKIKKGEVDIGNFGSTLKKKWADTTVMEKAFGKFSELSEAAYVLVDSGKYDTAAEAIAALSGKYSELAEKAFKSAQTAKTFTEAIDATKDAVSSGWMKTFEIIFGNYVEATELWTEFTDTLWDIFASGADTRNELLQEWKDMGGRDDFIQAFKNIYHAIMAIVTPIKEAFRKIFPAKTAEDLFALTKGIKEFTARLKIGDDTSKKLKDTFLKLFKILKTLKDGFVRFAKSVKTFIWNLKPALDVLKTLFEILKDIGIKVGKVLKSLFEKLKPFGEVLLDFSEGLGAWLTNINEAIKKSDALNKAFEKVKTVLTNAAKKVKEAFDKMRTAIENFTGLDLTSFGTFIQSFKEKFHPIEAISKAVSKAFEYIGIAIEFLKKIFKKVGPFLSKVGKKIGEAFKSMNFGMLIQLFTTGAFAGVFVTIKNLISSLKGVADSAGGFLSSITGILDGVRKSLAAYEKDIKAKTLLKIAASIAILAISLLLLASIDEDKLASSMMAITVLFGELFGSMSIFNKITEGKAFSSLGKVTRAMVVMAIALLILSKAVTELAKNDWEDLTKGMVGVGLLVGMMVASAKLLEKVTGSLIKTSIGLAIFAVSIRLLVTSVKALGKMEMTAIIQGLMGLLLVLGMLAGFMVATKSAGLTPADALALMGIALAVRIIASALKTLAKIETDALFVSIFAMTAVLTVLGIFITFVESQGGFMSIGAGLVMVGVSMLIFAKALAMIGKIPIFELITGLLGMTAALTGLAMALQLMPTNMVAIGFGLMAVGVALVLMAATLKILATMSIEEIITSILALGLALTVIAVAVNAMTGALAGAAALLIVSAALLGLAIVLKIMATMSLAEIGLALLTIAGTLAVLGVAAALLTPVIPMMMLLGAALLLIGIGLAAVGAATLILGIGLATLAAAGFEGVLILLALAGALIPLTLLAPGMLIVGAALLILAVGIFAIGGALMVLSAGLGLLVALGPAGNEALIELAATATAIAEFALQILLAGAALLLFGAGALLAGAGAIVAGLGLMVLSAGLRQLAKVDISNMGGFTDLAIDLLKASAMLLLAAPGLLVGGAALIIFGSGAQSAGKGLNAIQVGITETVKAAKEVPGQIEEAILSIIDSVVNLIFEVTKAMDKQRPHLERTTLDLIENSIKAINSKKNSFSNAGVNMVSGFIQGIRSRITTAANTAAYMAQSALNAANDVLKIKSPSRAFGETARFSILGFVNDFKKYTPLAVSAASDMSYKTLRPVMEMTDNFSTSTNKIGLELQRLSQRVYDTAPTITTEKETTVHHVFDTLHVEGVNDEKEFVAAADYSVEEMLTSLMRRQNRV